MVRKQEKINQDIHKKEHPSDVPFFMKIINGPINKFSIILIAIYYNKSPIFNNFAYEIKEEFF